MEPAQENSRSRRAGAAAECCRRSKYQIRFARGLDGRGARDDGRQLKGEELQSFDEFLERRFPESRRKAYYLISIHEHLPPQAKKKLKQVGWAKAAELTKVARSDGNAFDCATWLHKAHALPKEQFKHEVKKHLTGKDSEPTEIIYFKLYRARSRWWSRRSRPQP